MSLNLEITEGILLNNTERIVEMFKELNSMGIKFQIDDFGTGYSALSYVQDFPIQTIKIDRAFIQKLGTGNTAEIVRTIIIMAHDLGKDAIAEGIETEDQLKYLQKIDCDAGQGYLLSHPIDEAGIESLLRMSDSEIKTQPAK